MDIKAFIEKWGVVPPRDFALTEPDSPREQAAALLTGRWGIVPVFAWTTDEEIATAVKQIRQAVGKSHHDAEGYRRGELAHWLRTCGFTPSEIAGAVWDRETGLQRPKRVQIKRNKALLAKADRLVKKYMKAGYAYLAAESKAFADLQGREAPAAAAVRMAIRRHGAERATRKAKMVRPVDCEPVAFCITQMLHAAYLPPFNTSEVTAILGQLRAKLLGQSA